MLISDLVRMLLLHKQKHGDIAVKIASGAGYDCNIDDIEVRQDSESEQTVLVLEWM